MRQLPTFVGSNLVVFLEETASGDRNIAKYRFVNQATRKLTENRRQYD